MSVNVQQPPYLIPGIPSAMGEAKTLTTDAAGNLAVLAGSYTTRNRIINGSILIDQRNITNPQTFTAGAAAVYSVDRWFVTCSGANVTGQQIVGTIGNFLSGYRFTGAASVTGIKFAQRIESFNCVGMTSQNVTLSAQLRNSVLTTVTWTAYSANATDNFAAKTQIATGTFTVTNAYATYSATFNAGANAANGIEIEFSVGAQTSGTWEISGVQLEMGTTATNFENRSIALEANLCRRYCVGFIADGWYVMGGIALSTAVGQFSLPYPMRAAPTVSVPAGAPVPFLYINDGSTYNTFTSIDTIVFGRSYFSFRANCAAATMIVARPLGIVSTSSLNYVIFSAEL
jgi:hypothetical protein